MFLNIIFVVLVVLVGLVAGVFLMGFVLGIGRDDRPY